MRLVVLFGMLCCVPPCLAVDFDTAKTRLLEILNEEDIPGFYYAVLDESRVVFQYSTGYQSIEEKQPVSANTFFMLNSSSKVFTAAAIMQLIDTGKIKPSDRLSQYFKDHPYGDDITILHLLNQTSGIPNPLPIKWLHLEEDHHLFNESDTLSKVMQEDSKLSFTPGEKYAYSNISYWLLGKVIEKVSGLDYCTYIQDQVFRRLNISANELSCKLPDKAAYAFGYQKKYSFLSLFFYIMGADQFYDQTVDGYLRFKRVYHSGPAYGGLFGTGQGVAKFLQDLLQETPRLMSAEIKKLLYTQQQNNAGESIPMTLGWKVGNINGIHFYEKPGGGPGTHSNVRIYPENKLATLYFLNKTDVDEGSISDFSSKLDGIFLQH